MHYWQLGMDRMNILKRKRKRKRTEKLCLNKPTRIRKQTNNNMQLGKKKKNNCDMG
jgi:hypothetical protein